MILSNLRPLACLLVLGAGLAACSDIVQSGDSADSPAAVASAPMASGSAAEEESAADEPGAAASAAATTAAQELPKTDDEWRKKLTPEQYYVCRTGGTERAFTGKYWDTKTKGTYKCVACGQQLFSSETKYKSGSGWPSFYKPVNEAAIDEHVDSTAGMIRTEIRCSKCDAHLGHVFDDGPEPTGLRYCLNSAALDLAADE